MARRPTPRRGSSFWREAHELRDRFGEIEYETTDLLPGMMALLRRHLKDDDELLRSEALHIIDRLDRQDAGAHDGFFPYDAHVALGEKKRIRRGAMTLDHLFRRKRVVDDNYSAQGEAWRKESDHLYKGMSALRDKPSDMKLENVLAEKAA